MKLLSELDHYEVLEVARDARREEIERAFALVRGAYDGESLAGYSVVPPDEAKLWRERIDEAWRVLSDPAARAAYDAALAGVESGGADEDGECDPFAGMDDDREAALGATFAASARAELPASPDAPPTSLAAARGSQPLAVEPPAERLLPRDLEAFEDGPEDEGAEWTGARLRRARLLRGLEIDDVAAATKVNPTYLRFLEEERFEDLPALVYVRGFVGAYARLLGLDPMRVAPSYVARCEEQRRAKPRGRFLSRPHGRPPGP